MSTTPKLRPDIKKEWLRRLRSGEYKQGSGRLKVLRPDGTAEHCCLGVLCEMAQEVGVVANVQTEDRHSYTCFSFDGDSALPPQSVLDWAFKTPLESGPYSDAWEIGPKHLFRALTDDTGYDENDSTNYLPELNDLGFTFEQIADQIEQGNL